MSSEERWERFGPLQQHRRAVASLEKQIQQRREQLEEVSCLFSLEIVLATTEIEINPDPLKRFHSFKFDTLR